MVGTQGPASGPEKALLALALGLMPALVFFEWSFWHPGWARVDEAAVFLRCNRWQDAIEVDIRAMAGCLQRFTLILSSNFLGNSLASLHLPQALFLVAESLLLFSVARRIFGEREATWAVLCNLLCAFTLMRGRSLLSYSLLPLELLLLAELYARFPSTWGRTLWGACAGLITLDYELWLFGAALAAAFATLAPGPRAPKIGAGLGLALSLAVVAWLSRDNLQTYAAVRTTVSAPRGALKALSTLASHLKSFWLGGPTVPYIASSGHPVFPAWAWPGLAVGIAAAWRGPRWLLWWVAAAFLPLAFRSPGLEPQRALLAWPALCAISGAGMAWLARRSALWSPWLLLLPLGGMGIELNAHASSMRQNWAGIYGPSNAQLMAVKLMDDHDGPALLNLDFHSSSGARYLLRRRTNPGGAPVALMPWYALPALKFETGRLESLKDPRSGHEAWLFFPDKASVSRMLARDQMLGKLWNSLGTRNLFSRSKELESRLKDPQWRDPWLRSVLWNEYLESLHYLGRLEDRHIEELLSEKLPSAEPFRECALRDGRRRPALAIRLMERAAAIDSRLPFSPELRAPLEYFQALENRPQAR